ncbi:MAG: hypothetical protein ABTQ73_04550 [Caldilineales bacterium]
MISNSKFVFAGKSLSARHQAEAGIDFVYNSAVCKQNYQFCLQTAIITEGNEFPRRVRTLSLAARGRRTDTNS